MQAIVAFCHGLLCSLEFSVAPLKCPTLPVRSLKVLQSAISHHDTPFNSTTQPPLNRFVGFSLLSL
ncbi:hypothetical protein Hdeb2414_s0943g00964761 [Helianthus debilis subsp. tardiflorus]